MAVLAKLKLVNAKKSNSISPTQLRRNKLSRKLWEQIELAKAVAAGGQYSKRRFKTFKGADGSRASVEVRSGSAKLNMLDKCIIGAFSHGIGAVTGGHHEQIIWAANPPRIQFGVQGQGGFGRVA